MADTGFSALVVERTEEKQFRRKIAVRQVDDLPPGDLLVRVRYSSLNYKDALSATGHPGVTRSFPHTPGIDAAGEVISCGSKLFSLGDRVIVTGHNLGMETDGGFGQYIRVPSEWAVPLPDGLSLHEAMAIGTAGFTAALSVYRLGQAAVAPDSGDVLVTGATGGVGSVAVGLLASLGHRVIAVSGKPAGDFLRSLGAAEVIPREQLTTGADKALLPERWAGAVDVVGGTMLSAVLKGTRYGGTVTCCGLVGSPELPVNVYPFILRGVSLVGIDSVNCPRPLREEIWRRLAHEWKIPRLREMTEECTLEGLEERIHAILRGDLTGRVVVNLQ